MAQLLSNSLFHGLITLINKSFHQVQHTPPNKVYLAGLMGNLQQRIHQRPEDLYFYLHLFHVEFIPVP